LGAVSFHHLPLLPGGARRPLILPKEARHRGRLHFTMCLAV